MGSEEEVGGIQFDAVVTALITQAREKTRAVGERSAPKLPIQKKVSLLLTGGPLKGKTFPINKPQVLIGRTEADIVIDDSKVSRKHCVVEVHDMVALLVDLDSNNGTFVNGRKIASCELNHLAEFQVGSSTLTLAIT
jgi:Inner membrane component of T3SS, cytoplasmic domain